MSHIKNFLNHLWKEIRFQQLFDGAAVLSFYFFLSLFPLLFVFISMAGYLPLDEIGARNIEWWQEQVPPMISNLIVTTLQESLTPKSGGLISVVSAVAVLLASNGIAAVIRQLNSIYRVQHRRNFLLDRLYAIFLTLGFGALTILPFWLDLKLGIEAGRSWLLGAFLFMALIVIYYIGPHVRTKFRFTIPGALFGAFLLVQSTKIFEAYINNFSNYGILYGSLGAVTIMLIWLYLLGLLIICGGYINQALRMTLGFGEEV